MQKQKKVNYSLMAYIKFSIVIGLCLGLVVGCAGTGEAPTESASAQAAAKKESQIPPQARQEYETALEAMRAGNNDKAKTLLTSLAQTYPTLSGPQTNLGLIYFREGKIDEAEAAFKQAIKVNPNSAVSYNHLGIINRGKGNFTEARDNYAQALQINSDYAYAHLNIGILYDLYLGELDKALQHYQRFQELSPEKDPEVDKWIVDLERRIKSAQ